MRRAIHRFVTVPANNFHGEMTTFPEQLFVLAVLGGL